MVVTMDQHLLREWRVSNLITEALINSSCSFFLSQNTAISAGTVTGIPLNLKVLGVGDGLTV